MIGGFQVGRGKDRDQADIFASRTAFVKARARAGSDFADFCKVLDRRFSVSAQWRMDRDQMKEGTDIPDRWQGVPWLTPVLGSGCYDVPDAAISPATAERVVAEALERPRPASLELAHRLLIDIGLDPAPHVSAFVRQMAQERAPSWTEESHSERSNGSGELTVDEPAILMALAASYLTLLYRLVQVASGTPFDRNDETYARFGPKAPLSDAAMIAGGTVAGSGLTGGAKFIRDLGAALADVIEELGDLVGRADLDGNVVEGLRGLLDEVRTDLNSKQLRSSQVRFVTEAAWYLLARKAAIYHGWADLLFEIMVNDPEPRSHRSPYFSNFQEGPKGVLPALMREATEQSWARQSAGSEMKRFYKAVAGVMWAQSAAITSRREQGRPTKLPPSSTFLTSFDLELEMALWDAMETGESFAVILPVYVSAPGTDSSAYPCWLRGVVGKSGHDDGLRRIMRPDDWHLLFHPGIDDDELRRLPNVVRLCGSPLVDLPTLDQMPEVQTALAQVDVPVARGWHVTHAITFNEYLAIRQSEAELILGIREAGPSGQKPPTRNLPRVLGASSSDRAVRGENPRYWFGAGVPLGDRAVRHRLISQITATHVWNEVESRSAPAEQTSRPKPTTGPAETDAAAESGQDHDDWFSTDEKIPGQDDDGASPDPAPNLAGVMVNRRVANDEALLLSWFGLDAVQAMANEFTADLEHYATHLRRLACPSPSPSDRGNEPDVVRPELDARASWGSLQSACPLHGTKVGT